ncbi:hypothetical protein GO730_30635 [Spirosoma sp. HMF3257]|uniref:Uncharacterized protein n=1 Tax=Spirosoma telluris TaxID=2183553 RepID=A0A327NPT5_9BACT|nr:hypothetical protein [Spirosoma telluris]RAI77431.1 hypothetical protein HMF3257_30540 [Spirosoma telluris]
MNPTNLFSKKSINPYKNEALNKIYGLLFCDNLDLYKSQTQSTAYPWNILFAESPDPGQLVAMTTDNTLETRHKLLAYHLLVSSGFPVNSKVLLGVVAEVALPDGLDVLAVFSDGTCRYINHSEKLLAWDVQTEQSNQLVQQLFSHSIKVVDQIGPWDKGRTSFPDQEMIKLTFLVSDGLYFGQGPLSALMNDRMAGPVIHSAIQLMGYLINQTV